MSKHVVIFPELTSKERFKLFIYGTGFFMAVAFLCTFIYLCVVFMLPRPIPNSTISPAFEFFLKKFGKKYVGGEYQRRLKIFEQNRLEIDRLNKMGDAKDSARFAVNEFADMSKDEFVATKGCLIRNTEQFHGDYYQTCPPPYLMLPEFDDKPMAQRFDWRNHGYVGPVLYQGMCGNCWAHSVVGVMETMISKHRKSFMTSLSIQELTDCSDYNAKCAGGNAESAAKFLCRKQLPIVPKKYYPSVNRNQTCKIAVEEKNKPKHGGVITAMGIKSNISGMKLAALVETHGPVAVNIDARALPWYSSGVIKFHCSESYMNHVVQVIGYDLTAETPHLILKNSWGTEWGEKGYFKTAIVDGQFICGVGRMNIYLDAKMV